MTWVYLLYLSINKVYKYFIYIPLFLTKLKCFSVQCFLFFKSTFISVNLLLYRKLPDRGGDQWWRTCRSPGWSGRNSLYQQSSSALLHKSAQQLHRTATQRKNPEQRRQQAKLWTTNLLGGFSITQTASIQRTVVVIDELGKTQFFFEVKRFSQFFIFCCSTLFAASFTQQLPATSSNHSPANQGMHIFPGNRRNRLPRVTNWFLDLCEWGSMQITS